MPLTLRQLVKLTKPPRRESADLVKIIGMKVRRTKDGAPAVIAKTRSIADPRTGNPRAAHETGKYISEIEFHGKYVIVGCSCDDFMYRHEYALYKLGAARLEYSNGDPPNTTNPGMVPSLCKHLLCLANHLIAKGEVK